jgi:hypothetical protein
MTSDTTVKKHSFVRPFEVLIDKRKEGMQETTK